MVDSPFGKLIRSQSTKHLSCTLVESADGKLRFANIPFRKAKEDRCGILFYEYEGEYYYPLSLEFRLIDNNLLFLIEELGMRSFRLVADTMASSFKRDENRDVIFFAVVYHTAKSPRHALKLTNFSLDSETDEVIHHYAQ